MAQKLTTFSKFLITLLIVGAVVFGGRWILNNTEAGKEVARDAGIENTGGGSSSSTSGSATTNSGSSSSSSDAIKIAVVTWGGYAGGQYFNEGFSANKNSRFYKDYGFEVEFKLLDDVDASLAAWKRGDVDLHWYTIDAFPTLMEGIQDYDPVVLWQADWSRGGDAIVARRGINNVADLKGKKVAVAELTPSHSFLLWMLDAGGMSIDDIEVVPQSNAIDAAEVFKSGRVDAAVVWSPDDEAALRAVPGSRVLESTKSASNIIADVFFAKREFVEKNRDKIAKLYEGWMKGAAEINSNPANKQKAIKILSEGLGIPAGDADVAINNVRLVTHGDNVNFFDLNTGYKGVTGSSLYSRMTAEYQDLGFAAKNTPSWRRISYPNIVNSTVLEGAGNDAEGAKTFTKVSDEEAATKEAIASKPVSISFRTGEYQLDENAKYIIDREFLDIAKAFANSRIRIEGNTDNVGSRSSNVALSKRRAQSVASYLIGEHNIPSNRIIVIGNGPDKPVASNNNDAGKAKNRRTDFQLVRE
ncbi:MAG: phosphate ABC transporter substrate-binding/OmpA family protein [Saprospiraceae bacterium]